jgi:hypothetical protein
MVTIRQHHRVFELLSDWPGDVIICDLMKWSTGLFIWASMAVNFIAKGYDPWEQLKILLCAGSHQKPEVTL